MGDYREIATERPGDSSGCRYQAAQTVEAGTELSVTPEKCGSVVGCLVQLPLLPIAEATTAVAELWVALEATGKSTPGLCVEHFGSLVRITVTELPLSPSSAPLFLWARRWRGPAVDAKTSVPQPFASASLPPTQGSSAIRTRATARSRRSVAPRSDFKVGAVAPSSALSNATKKLATSPIVASRSSTVNPFVGRTLPEERGPSDVTDSSRVGGEEGRSVAPALGSPSRI